MAGRVHVTGAASFIAGPLIDRLQASGRDVGGMDLVPVDRPGFRVGDISGPDIHDALGDGSDVVVHLAAMSRDADCRGNAAACFAANVVAALNVLQAAQRNGVRQMIFASTEWVYDRAGGTADCSEDDDIDAGRLTSEYALSKRMAELALAQQSRTSGCDLTVLRFGIVYGERDSNWGAVESLLHDVATEPHVTVGSAQTARRYLHVEDVAAAVCRAIDCQAAGTFNIQGPRLVTLGDVVQVAAGLLRRQVQLVETAPDAASVRRVSGEKAAEVLDWRAAIGIEEGLARLIRHFGLAVERAAVA